MTPEQWEQIGQFYHAALESAPPERADFVARVCAGDEALRRLWVRQLAAFSSAQIIPPARVIYGGLAFSRDGNHIFYVMREEKSPVAALYRIPLLGGASRKIIESEAASRRS